MSRPSSFPLVKFGTAADGTPLSWMVSQPAGAGPWPALLGIHGGGHRTGGPSTPLSVCGADLTAAGYIVFSPQYPLTVNKLPGQVGNGQYPQQTDAIVMAFQAMKSDPRCNGSTQCFGGSAGGYMAAWLAVHGYCSAAAMSPDTDLDDPVSLQNQSFNTDVNLYAPGMLGAASPINYVSRVTKSIYVGAYAVDNMPAPQHDNFVASLKAAGAPYVEKLIPGPGHSFDMWPLVKTEVIAFLNAHK
ncbi:MAG: hypothetical protein ABI162_07040 [Luteolibacter sp.]